MNTKIPGPALKPQPRERAVACSLHGARLVNGVPRPACMTWNASGRCDVDDATYAQRLAEQREVRAS